MAAHGLWEWPDADHEVDVGYEVEQPPEAIAALIDEQAAAGFQIQPTMRTIRNTQSMFDDRFLNSPLLDEVLSPAYLDYLRGPAQVQRDIFLSTFGGAIAPGADPAVVGSRLETFNSRYEQLVKRFSDKGGRLLLGDRYGGGRLRVGFPTWPEWLSRNECVGKSWYPARDNLQGGNPRQCQGVRFGGSTRQR